MLKKIVCSAKKKLKGFAQFPRGAKPFCRWKSHRAEAFLTVSPFPGRIGRMSAGKVFVLELPRQSGFDIFLLSAFQREEKQERGFPQSIPFQTKGSCFPIQVPTSECPQPSADPRNAHHHLCVKGGRWNSFALVSGCWFSLTSGSPTSVEKGSPKADC